MKFEDIKKGDVLYECEYGHSIKIEVLDDPIQTKGGKGYSSNVRWELKGKTENAGVIDYMQTEGFAHYGPHLYREDMYVINPPTNQRSK